MTNKSDVDGDDIRATQTDAVLKRRFAKPKATKRVAPPPNVDKQFWHEAMMVSMQTLQVRSPDKIQQCAALADEYLAILTAKFKKAQ